MALSVVAVFIDLQEAHIAAGALRAAGLRAEVFDSQYGTVDWVVQAALGGFRVAVPQSHAADAVALIGHIHDTAPDPGPPEARSVVGGYLRAGGAAGIFMLFGFGFGRMGDEWAWLLARRRGLGAAAWVGMVLTLVLLIGAGAGVALLIYILLNLLINPP